MKPPRSTPDQPMSRPTLPSTPRAVADERRRYERAQLKAEIGVYSDTNFYTGFSEDISAGGMFVATYDLRPMGSEVKLEFMLPGGHEVKVSGVVRWVKDPVDEASGTAGMGIQFGDDLSAEDLEAITEFVNNREPLFHVD